MEKFYESVGDETSITYSGDVMMDLIGTVESVLLRQRSCQFRRLTIVENESLIVGTSVADDRAAMQLALNLATDAGQLGEVPVGAVVVRDGVVIAARHNERETTQDPTGHAEVLALRDAAHVIGQWRLNDCSLVVTLEPCVMCAGALMNARIGRLVYGAADPKGGATASLYNVCADPRLNHEPVVVHGVCEQEAQSLLQVFFAQRRNSGGST